MITTIGLFIYAIIVTAVACGYAMKSAKNEAKADINRDRLSVERELRNNAEFRLRDLKEDHEKLSDAFNEAKFQLMLVPYQRRIDEMNHTIGSLIQNQCDGCEEPTEEVEETVCPDLMACCERCSETAKE